MADADFIYRVHGNEQLPVDSIFYSQQYSEQVFELLFFRIVIHNIYIYKLEKVLSIPFC